MKILFAAVALALLANAVVAQEKSHAEAHRVFEGIRAKYSALDTYSMTMIREIASAQGKPSTQVTEFSFRQPNRYSARTVQADGEAIVVSNGRTAYTYFPLSDKTKYFALPMPPAELGRVGIMQYYSPIFLTPILAGVNPFAAPWGEAPHSITFGQSTVVEGSAVDTVVVRLAGAEKETQTYYIGKYNRLLHRITRSGGKGDQAFTIVETYRNVRLNPKIPIDTFAFVPPQNTVQGNVVEHYPFATSIRVGATPPPLIGLDLNGQSINLADFRGKVVLLDFWATWCAPCWVEVPHIKAAYEKFHQQGFEIIGISFDEKRAALENYTRVNEMPWPQIFDGKRFQTEASAAYQVQAIPMKLLIGKDGKVAAIDPRKLLLEPQIEKALAQEP